MQSFQAQSFFAFEAKRHINSWRRREDLLSEGVRPSSKELIKVRNEVAELETNFQKFVIYDHL